MNSNIAALQTIVNALQTNDYVTSVTPVTKGEETIGYTITFSNSDPITIYHGTNGEDGHTPIIGVKQAADGIYYWTVDGEWLLDENGSRVRVYGNDDIVPQLKIEGGYWCVSYDNGASWTQLSKATGEDGDSFFKSVAQDDNNVYFTLADNTVITLPKGSALEIIFEEEALVGMLPNSNREIGYTVKSDTDSVVVEITSSADIKARVVTDDESGLTGKVHIATGDVIDEYSKVIVFVSNGQRVIMRSISFEKASLVVDEMAVEFFSVDAEGCEVALEFWSNVECEAHIPDDAQSWISVVPNTRAMEKSTITLRIEPNDGAYRSAEVTVRPVGGELSISYWVGQRPKEDSSVEQLEREALIAIYNALDGDNWVNNSNWCSDRPLNEWYGVETDGWYVIGLDIKGRVTAHSPKSIFPEEAQNLRYLKYLHLENTSVDSFADGLSLSNLEELWCHRNVFLHLTELAPIYNLGNLKEFRVFGCDNDLYSISDTALTPTPIPDELLDNKALQTLCLDRCNLSGVIPDKLWELTNLELLSIYNAHSYDMCGDPLLSGTFPSDIANLSNLESLNISNVDLSGGIPEEIYTLTKLVDLSIDHCSIGGQLSPNMQNLKNLTSLNLRRCDLEGELPEELAILMDGKLNTCMLSENRLSGNIPDKISAHPKWAQMWSSIVDYNQFSLTVDDIPAPSFNTKDVWGNRLISDDIYKNNSYTIIYGYNFSMFPYISNAVYSCHEMHKLYNSYKQCGVEVIMFDGSGYSGPGTKAESVQKFLTENNLPWSAVLSNPFGMAAIPYIVVVDSMGKVAYATIIVNPIPSIEDVWDFFEEKFPNEYYTSTDYSQDGVVTTLQTATKGNGINIVLMGDAYSDRQIADGTYRRDMEYIYNNLFTEEPYKSFKDHFNVYCVNVVSATEGYDYGNTAIGGYFGDGTLVGGNDNAVFSYALNAISANDMNEALLIVAMNSDNYAGTCYMYYPDNETGTYGSGVSVAYFPRGGNQTVFAQLLHHEACGHGFAKLNDEYAYEEYGHVPSNIVLQTQREQSDWGWWKNVDFTGDQSAVRWSNFIADVRYANEGLGAFEGGMTYWTGVWRPTENSIMRYNTGGFNAPSREAIYYRIHKLAYGDSWEYDYEEFVEWDAINRTAEASAKCKAAKPVIYQPTHAPIVVNKSWRDAK